MTEHVRECEHKNIAINPSLTTSVMAITLNIFGFKCEGCEKQWDVGNAVEAIQATERLIVAMKDPNTRGAVTTLQMCKLLDGWIDTLEGK